MVEGPGATRNSRKVQVAVGKTLIASDETLPHHLAGELVGHTLEQAFSVGKEVFLIFISPDEGSCALRLHFGMNGSLYARKVKSGDVQEKASGLAPWKQKSTPSLRLYFVDNNQCVIIVEAWETTVTYPVSATNARNKLMDLTSRDACSTLFNAQGTFTSVRQLGNNLIISDALLNQDIFPGVGNIIKNEALHRSKRDEEKTPV